MKMVQRERRMMRMMIIAKVVNLDILAMSNGTILMIIGRMKMVRIQERKKRNQRS